MENERVRKATALMFETLKQLDTELLVHRSAAAALIHCGYLTSATWEDLLKATRGNPAIQKMMDDRYQELLGAVTQAIDEADFEEQVQELLKRRKPTTLPN